MEPLDAYDETTLPGEDHIATIHTHQYSLAYGMLYNVAHSPQDIWNVRSKDEGFMNLVQSGNRIFAIVVLDSKKAEEFFSGFNSKEQFVSEFYKIFDEELKNGVKSVAQRTSNSIRALIGTSDQSGIGFFRTNDNDNTKFIKTN